MTWRIGQNHYAWIRFNCIFSQAQKKFGVMVKVPDSLVSDIGSIIAQVSKFS